MRDKIDLISALVAGGVLVSLGFYCFQLHRRLQSRSSVKRKLIFNIGEAPLPMMMLNEAGIIVDANMPLRALFGWIEQDLIGRSLNVLLPAAILAQHEKLVDGFFASPFARTMGAGKALTGLHRNGDEIPIEVGLSAVPTEGGIFVIASIADLSEKRRLEQGQQEAYALMSAIIRSAPFSIITTDNTGKITAMSPAAERMLGYTQQELVGWATADLLHDPSEVIARAAQLTQELGEVVEPGFDVFVAKARRGIAEEHQWTYRHKDGTLFPVSLTVTALRDGDSQVIGFLVVAYDVSERLRSEKYIRFLAHHDELTGLPNRVLLKDRMDLAIYSARRSGRHFALMLIDLDHFKQVNDSFGHHIGDQLLIGVAGRLDSCVRSTDTVARLGGDEFVILLTDIYQKDTAMAIADKVVKEVSREFQLENNLMKVSPSIGLAFYPQDGKDPDVLLRNADVAMYAAKHEGGARVKIYCLLPKS